MSETVFALSRPGHHVRAFGSRTQFTSIDAARAALATGVCDHIVGALPFDLGQPAALIGPERVERDLHPWDPPRTQLPVVDVTGAEPAPDDHTRRVRDALELLEDPASALVKVVLARTLHLHARTPIVPTDLLARLASADPGRNGFLADLTPAGPRYRGHHLIGSSPEVLVERSGSTVRCHPLAGSAARVADPAADHDNGQMLAASTKDHQEHAFVVDSLASALAPLCSRLEVPAAPTLSQTPALWHLGTPIEGTLRDTTLTALDLATILHPTPAVCGTPTADAKDYILTHESDRGFYAGTVGWCDASGDGEWMVSIRCAELEADRKTLHAMAGGGIVAGSDAELELAETTTKFRTILSALGIATSGAGPRA